MFRITQKGSRNTPLLHRIVVVSPSRKTVKMSFLCATAYITGMRDYAVCLYISNYTLARAQFEPS